MRYDSKYTTSSTGAVSVNVSAINYVDFTGTSDILLTMTNAVDGQIVHVLCRSGDDADAVRIQNTARPLEQEYVSNGEVGSYMWNSGESKWFKITGESY